ncbi:hypothetical protein CDAR_215991 [Caerostris darwini]|uniref:Uncharacterized protein n=1 Tax=Caerostris darwini TaxID=1538125 RepID=A0AAV4NMW3_9ARAC|nr:hypothetical protein CDAR_215991 [Caerostris darwini]
MADVAVIIEISVPLKKQLVAPQGCLEAAVKFRCTHIIECSTPPLHPQPLPVGYRFCCTLFEPYINWIVIIAPNAAYYYFRPPGDCDQNQTIFPFGRKMFDFDWVQLFVGYCLGQYISDDEKVGGGSEVGIQRIGGIPKRS